MNLTRGKTLFHEEADSQHQVVLFLFTKGTGSLSELLDSEFTIVYCKVETKEECDGMSEVNGGCESARKLMQDDTFIKTDMEKGMSTAH